MLVRGHAHSYVVCELMQRVVSTLLIPLLLVSQGLFSAVHSHAAPSNGEPDAHTARPHVHLHGAGHHHGHHETGDEHDFDSGSPKMPVGESQDHGSDAIYVGEIQLLNNVKVAKVPNAELSVACINYGDAATVMSSGLSTRQPASRGLRPSCALYLQTLSIRC